MALAVFLAIPSASRAASTPKLSGSILGLVTDAAGIPQMGATVLLYNHQDRLYERALTDEKGSFSFRNLFPDSYSIHVSLASFLPALKNNILVKPGIQSLLNVSLAGLFSSIQIILPTPEQRAIMNDNWKWVLRTSSATRPILRLRPGWKVDDPAAAHRSSSVFSDTRGLVKVSAADGGVVSEAGSESDLGTAFALATSLFGRNQLQLSGNFGYVSQSGMPAAGFRTSYSRDAGEGSPEVTLTMRQLFLPGRVGAALVSNAGGAMGAPALRTLSVSFDDRTQLTDNLKFEYGFSLDSVTFFDRLNYFSPYGRLTYFPSQSDALEFTYASGVPRSDLFNGTGGSPAELQNEIHALSLFPRVTLRGGRAKVQRGENFELAYRKTIGSRTYRAAAYREGISNAALTMLAPDGVPSSGEILPDFFSNSYAFNAGEYQSVGYRASVTQSLGEHLNVSVIYGSEGALVADPGEPLTSHSPEELRSMIRSSRRQSFTTRVSGTLPSSGTQFIASYQWSDRASVTPGLLYSALRMRTEPGLNIYIRQPIPTLSVLPWRLEATADLRNLLEQGYLPISLSGGSRLVLMQTPRTFRGGLSFIF